MTEYGSGGGFSVTMDGPFSGGGSGTEKLTVIRAGKGNWKGGTSPYSQNVSVDGISVTSKVNIYMSADQIEQLSGQRITFTIENKAGVATLYAIGDLPASDCEFQATLIDILNVSTEAIETIQGNVISTHAPRPDHAQEDEAAADFIKNKPDIIDMDVFSLTLYKSNWADNKQKVEASKVLADESRQAIISTSDPGSLEIYLDCNIRMEAQGNGTLTFACDDVPTSNVVVNIMILTKGV